MLSVLPLLGVSALILQFNPPPILWTLAVVLPPAGFLWGILNIK